MSDKYTRDQMITKIQKLLNLAEDNTNEAQAAAAAAKAQELMTQWAVDEAALDAASGKQSDPFTSEEVPYLGKTYERWEGSLLMAVGDATSTHPFRNNKRLVFTFAGRSKDVAIAVYMFCTLRNTLQGLSRRRLSEHGADLKLRTGKSIYNAKQCRVLSGCHPTVYRQRWLDSWLRGAEMGVRAKLQEQRQQTTVQNSTALVVVQTRAAEAEDWATEKFKLTPSKASKARKTFSDALGQGIKDGKAIELRKGIAAAVQQQITGD